MPSFSLIAVFLRLPEQGAFYLGQRCSCCCCCCCCKKKALCLALPLSELETTLNQDQYMLCSCFTVTFFNFMGRMFHNCPCNYACGRWQGAFLGNTWFLVRKGPLRGNAGTDALSEACFLNYFTSSGVPVGAWHSPKERLCACPSHSSAVTTVLWILTVPACLGQ